MVKSVTIMYVDELKLCRSYTVGWLTGLNDLCKLKKKRFNTTVETNVRNFAWEQIINGRNSV